jgi:hypothetical protein
VAIPDSLMTLRDYALRRGVSTMTISRAVKRGKLKASVVYGPRGEPKICDPELADREWNDTTDYTTAPQRAPGHDGPVESSAVEGMSLSEASAAEKVWRAKLAELKYKEAASELISAKSVEQKLQNVFTTCKTKLLGLPTRARQALPHLTLADVASIEDLVREALESLADNE